MSTAAAAAAQPAGTSILAQPARLPAPARPGGRLVVGSQGALAVVFTGLPAGIWCCRCGCPKVPGQWARLAHFLADPGVAQDHLVRVRDRGAGAGAISRIC